MLKFPYGNSNFEDIISANYYYVDRTGHIPLLEEAGKSLLFLRPRRFGKSLLLSMLENYYDVAKADRFESLFGGLTIGQQPTPRHNQYFVLKWDFSTIDPQGETDEIKQALHNHINGCMVSLLYYFGVLTLTGRQTRLGKLIFTIPNLVVRSLYVERIYDLLAPDFSSRKETQQAAEQFYQSGAIGPLCDLIEQRYFKLFDNRDYRWANELTIKTLFLTLLFNDTFYIVDSETVLERSYADMTLIVRPDMRQFELLDFLLEFKYVSLSRLGLTGAEVKQMSEADLWRLGPVQESLTGAVQKLAGYRAKLAARYGALLRLRVYSVIAVGYERVLWREVTQGEQAVNGMD